MNLRHLRYFVAVADQLSFSRASERLNISQSALSRQVQLFEADLGVRLFDRIGRRIALTPPGQDLLQRCQAILQDVESIAFRATELAGGSRGTLRVGATPQTLESVVSRFLPRFREGFPQIETVLVEDGSARLARQLERGRLDLAIAGRPSGSVLEGRVLFPLGGLAVVPSTHRFKGMAKLEVAELAGEALLLLRRQFMTRHLFDSACQAAGVRPRVMIESSSPHCLLSFVAARLGIAVVPSTVILDKLKDNAVPLYRDGKQLGFAMSVLWDPRRYVSPAAMAFVEELYESTRGRYPGKSFRFGRLSATVMEVE